MIVGKVLRANMRTFVFGTRIPESDVPTFGALVQTRNPYRQARIYGLIYDIALKDDERGMVKLLSVADEARQEDIEWLRGQMIPLEVSVLCVGYQPTENARIRHGLPAQPPIALHGIECCEADDIIQFTEQLDFFRLVLEAQDVPCDELLASIIRLATSTRAKELRRDYAVYCGRELARLLANDGARLEGLLKRLQMDTITL
jgi:hypothetical protein